MSQTQSYSKLIPNLTHVPNLSRSNWETVKFGTFGSKPDHVPNLSRLSWDVPNMTINQTNMIKFGMCEIGIPILDIPSLLGTW